MKKKLFHSKSLPVLIFIGVNLIIGFLTVVDYGVSTDEPLSWNFATKAFEYYYGMGEIVHVDYSHGGGFLVPAKLGQLLFSFIFPRWLEPFTWHIVYFILFQASVYFIYLLAKKFAGNWAASFAAIAYGTQPLLWGHAFINPKDTPFMILLLGSITFGIYLSDHIQNEKREISTFFANAKTALSEDKSKNFPFMTFFIVLVLIGMVAFLNIGQPLIHEWITSSVNALYHAEPSSFLGKIFGILAENANKVDVDLYIAKGINFYDHLLPRLNFFLGASIFLGIFGLIVPKFSKFILKTSTEILKIKYFFPAVILLGMCLSARTMGITALFIIGLYWLLTNGIKSAQIFWVLTLFAILVGLALWPHLWKTPVSTYSDYLENTFNFENWNGSILFEGVHYSKNNYPNTILPKLILLQITEPVLVLAAIGVVITAIKVFRKEYPWVMSGLLAGWFFAPLILAMVLHPVIYNAFRHFLFILPPIFIFAAIALDLIFTKLAASTWRFVLIAAIILPGLLGIVQLHPYEYIYYNTFAGGVKGAYQVYELDYWNTSYKAAIEYLNKYAQPHSNIVVSYGGDLVPWFANSDLELTTKIRRIDSKGIDYVVVSTNWHQDTDLLGYFPKMEEIHTIEIQGVPLARIFAFVPNE